MLKHQFNKILLWRGICQGFHARMVHFPMCEDRVVSGRRPPVDYYHLHDSKSKGDLLVWELWQNFLPSQYSIQCHMKKKFYPSIFWYDSSKYRTTAFGGTKLVWLYGTKPSFGKWRDYNSLHNLMYKTYTRINIMIRQNRTKQWKNNSIQISFWTAHRH